MKKNRTMRIATLMLALTLITCCFVGSTFANYTSTATGSDAITVAEWSITYTDAAGAKELAATTPPTVVFDLATTITDVGGDTDDAEVVNDRLAPGTAGSFELKVKNTAEVAANIKVNFSAVSSKNVDAESRVIPIPVVYSLTGADGTWKEDIAQLNYNEDHAVGADEDTITVYWQWTFEKDVTNGHSSQTDANDTLLGILAQTAAPQIDVTAEIVATQLD